MRLNRYYEQHLRSFLENVDLDFLEGKSVLISGVTGMIGSAIADALCMSGKNIRVLGLGRSQLRAVERFSYSWFSQDNFCFIEHDVTDTCYLKEKIDYIIHAASPAYPAAFAKYPVETMTANFIGTLNMLSLAEKNKARFLFVSSGEVYGEIDKSVKCEQDYGYIDSMQTRSCYPNSKRASETLCSAYAEEYGIDAVVVRLSHVYGPTMTESDNRVSSEFIRKAKLGQSITMRSTGAIERSYTYVLDAVTGIICALHNGKSGEAYNIADENKVVSIRQLAEITAETGNVPLITKEINKGEAIISRQVMSGNKLRNLGWKCRVDFLDGINITFKSIDVL